MITTFPSTILLLILTSSIEFSRSDRTFRPCSEISKEFKFPCRCLLEEITDGNPKIRINCDRVVFPEHVASLPYGAPVVSFSQKYVSYEELPTSVFTSNPQMPLRTVDLSFNHIRKLTDSRLLSTFKTTLMEVNLSDNLLGDTLNPIFSTNEFRGLLNLEILDLSGNMIRQIEDGIFQGCEKLRELNLDRNSLKNIPGVAFKGPKSLKIISLKKNQIIDIMDSKTDVFEKEDVGLEELYLDDNLISSIDNRVFKSMDKLRRISLRRNKLKTFNSDIFETIPNVEDIDLSQNFIEKIPSVALSSLHELKYLNLSSNLIQTLFQSDLAPFTKLRILDLSRNNIANVGPGTFLGMNELRKIDLSTNSLRTVEDDAFEGLSDLKELNLKDNNILLIPASALMRLKGLTTLHLDYNRITAISSNILRSITPKMTELIISKNLIRELPQASFQYFQNLVRLDLSLNSIVNLNPKDAFSGLENTLIHLDLSQNKIDALFSSFALTRLQFLDLSENALKTLIHPFNLPNLMELNLSSNPLKNLNSGIFSKMTTLEILDLSRISLRQIPNGFFSGLKGIKRINLSGNFLTEIPSGTFVNLPNLTEINLAKNMLKIIQQSAFVNLMEIKRLDLSFNELSRFSGEIFNTGSGLEHLDVSNNFLSYFHPTSFRIHPRLKTINVGFNRINFFNSELIATLQFLEELNLSHNFLKIINELEYAGLPRLIRLNLAFNLIENIQVMAFHNSTQLQCIELNSNRLERLTEGIFDGLILLMRLNLNRNNLSELPDRIFENLPVKSIDLSWNKFEVLPMNSLSRSKIDKINFSYNSIREVNADLVTFKSVDFAFNPLNMESIKKILTEPKIVRELNLAGVGISTKSNMTDNLWINGIKDIQQLETPFLTMLNLSFNNLSSFSEKFFERATLLEILDVSNNNFNTIENLNLRPLTSLQVLNVSRNDFSVITEKQVSFLRFHDSLRVLDLSGLKECVRIEKSAIASFRNLKTLNAFNYPRMGYFDVGSVLKSLETLENTNLEVKDTVVGSEHFVGAYHVRLTNLGIFGERIRSISPGIFTGLKQRHVHIKFWNTSLTELPPALLFGVPRSTKIDIDISYNKIKWLTSQFLTTLDDRKDTLQMIGVSKNPIECDCNARALRRWMPKVLCALPQEFSGRKIGEIGDNELSCDRKTTETHSNPELKTKTTSDLTRKTIEPLRTTFTPTRRTIESKRTTENADSDIIWSTTEKLNKRVRPQNFLTLNNEDTLVVSIVGGAVAFIIILMIIICIIRLKISGRRYRNSGGVVGQFVDFPGGVAPANALPIGGGGGGSCGCSVKSGFYGYSATLPYRVQAPPSGTIYTNYSTLGGGGKMAPNYVLPNLEDKNYR